MIGYLQGTILECEGSIVTLMVQGVGFEIIMPVDGLQLFDIGEEVKIYTYMHVRENEIGLYGFREQLEKKVFHLLLNVSGIGPKSAMQMLGVADAKEILQAVHQENEKFIFSLPGVGKKTAARIILELRDKVEKHFLCYISDESILETPKKKLNNNDKNGIKKDLTDTLVALGYNTREIEILFNETEVLSESDINIAVKESLQYLARS